MDWLQEAIKRMATPKHLREGTVEEFCFKYGIDNKQFYYQLSKEENKKKILETALNTAKESAPDVFDILVEKAKKGDMKAISIYMDSILQLAKELDLNLKGNLVLNFDKTFIKNNEIIENNILNGGEEIKSASDTTPETTGNS